MGIPDPPLSDLVPDKGPRARMRAALLEAALDFTGPRTAAFGERGGRGGAGFPRDSIPLLP